MDYDVKRAKKIKHPEFRYCTLRGASPIIFVFERAMREPPTPAQVKDYKRCEKIVELHGGRMILPLYNLGKENTRYTDQDVQRLQTIVQRAHPDLRPDKTWNGSGCYGVSIGMRQRTR